MLSSRILLVTAILSLIAAALFIAWPALDVEVASRLYIGDNRFILSHGKIWVFYDEYIRPALRYLLIALALWTLWLLWRRPARRPTYVRRVAFVVAVILIGPILIVEAGLKSHSGRARPGDIVEFAGDKTYTPPWVFTDQCDTNCSFVSGDAAAAFASLALALLAVRRRGLWIAASVLFGLAIGALRMSVGGHFFSDVIFAGLIVAAVTALSYRFILEGRDPPSG